MVGYICVRCGVQHAEAAGPPARCAICEDEREAVFRDGQQWTTPADLCCDHRNNVEPREPGLVGIRTEPRFAIGQQALLIQTPKGNVLWDCLSLIDDVTVEAVRAAGGLTAIASSHPHFYGAMAEWSRAFGGSQSTCTPPTEIGLCVRPRRWSSGREKRTRLLRI